MVILHRAVDGNLDAYYGQNSCTHTMYSFSPWLVIDLQGNYAITHVKIRNREDCCSKLIHKLSGLSLKFLLPYKINI